MHEYGVRHLVQSLRYKKIAHLNLASQSIILVLSNKPI